MSLSNLTKRNWYFIDDYIFNSRRRKDIKRLAKKAKRNENKKIRDEEIKRYIRGE